MGALKSASLATGKRQVYYPESDGKPMAETDLHRDEMFDLIARLQTRYADAPDVYVSGNLLGTDKEGDPRRRGGAGRVRGPGRPQGATAHRQAAQRACRRRW